MRRRGEAGRRWATETVDWSGIAAATEAIYLSVTAPENGARRG